MSLFFVRDEQERASKGRLPLQTLHRLECRACPLNNALVFNPKMEPHGPENARIYIIGEAPGEREDKEGEPFVGETGSYLRENLDQIDPNWLDYTRLNNCIRTRPPDNRNPQQIELEC